MFTHLSHTSLQWNHRGSSKCQRSNYHHLDTQGCLQKGQGRGEMESNTQETATHQLLTRVPMYWWYKLCQCTNGDRDDLSCCGTDRTSLQLTQLLFTVQPSVSRRTHTGAAVANARATVLTEAGCIREEEENALTVQQMNTVKSNH